ncbi:MAG: dihydrofolate reductase family protein [Candidatus Parcubacteria bacterium]|jgi:dihydrofolate reductase|nr:MAG: dihydrofolate reductase family protein [Candidatus Parcubacteria bacterium]
MIPVTLMMAISADGRIAKDSKQLADWTSPEDKKLFVSESEKHGVILMGENTFKTLPKALPRRLNVVFSENENPGQDGVRFVSSEPEIVLADLEAGGYHSALLGGGCYLNSQFLKRKLISEIVLTVEPCLFGSGLPLFDVDFPLKLNLLELKKINEHAFVVRYRVCYD